MRNRTSGGLAAGVLAAGLAAMLAFSGCGSSSGDGSTTSAPREAGAADGQAPAAAPGDPQQQPGAAQQPAEQPGTAKQDPGGNTAAKAPDKLQPDDRALIYTGTITVRVSDVDAKANEAITMALAANGHVGGDNRTRTDDGRSEARLVLRVPSNRFTAILGDLAKLGESVKREVSTQDVTEQIVDLNSRIATATASVERVRALLARATSLSEIVSLEAEVAKREAELESLKARLRKLSDLADLSTITVVLVDDEQPVQPEPKEDEPATGFMAGLKGGWDAFTSSLEVLLTILGALLPWFFALGLPALLLVVMLRRSAARRGPPAAVEAPAAAPAPAPATGDPSA